MELTAPAETARAFDSVAGDYHRTNAANPLLGAMRRRTLAVLTRHVGPGGHVLDVGCGPGTDAESLGAAGYHVTAVDGSARMVLEAAARVRRANLDSRVSVQHLAVEDLDALPEARFDAASSNFGPLNCVADLREAAGGIARRLKPGGVLVASVIGRVCPWEIALYLSRGDLPRLRVRFARGPVAVPLNGYVVWTRYLTPHELERYFRAAGFHRVSLRALGLLTPPPYMEAFAGRRPRVVARLQRLEDIVAGWPLLRSAGDHFLIVLRKGGSR